VHEPIRILIAEDNALLRGVLRDALAEAGMTVVAEASDGAEAVELAQSSTPDVVVMDMRMPNVDGIEATEQIANASWAMPVVVLSAYDEPQMIEAALAAGTQAILKLELFQHTGSFKARGALVNALSLDADERVRGICTISAGNHAIAAAFAARAVGDANRSRVARTRRATSSPSECAAPASTASPGNTASWTSSAFDGHRR